MNRRDDESWGRYWASGSLTSCADAFAGNYEGAIRAVWERRFAALADGARMLDLCTGNGAIALLAAAIARRDDKTLHIDAIDRATIFPERAVDDADRPLLDAIHFQAGIDAADLPFDDQSFDLVTGQFALEYTDVAATTVELARVVKPKGGALFVIHHDDSIILRTAAEERRHIALLLDKTQLFDRARELMEIVAAAPPGELKALSGDPAADSARERLNAAAADITDAIRESPHPEILRTALGYLGAAWQSISSAGAPAALAQLAASRDEIAANAGRLEDLITAAVSEQDLARVAAGFVARGFTVERGELVDDQRRLIGWTLDARRP